MRREWHSPMSNNGTRENTGYHFWQQNYGIRSESICLQQVLFVEAFRYIPYIGFRARRTPEERRMGVATPDTTIAAPATDTGRGVERLSDLSSAQWRSGIAAWLGWLFDGLDGHLYTLVAAPFVAQLLH